jgi:hypothetical protein
MNHRLGFAASAPWRATWAMAFAALAALGVVLIGTRKPMFQQAETVSPSTASTALVELSASYAVATWSVLVDGQALTATTMDARRWLGTIPSGHRELAIDAAPVDPLAGGPAALRITVRRDGREYRTSTWGDGCVGCRIDLEHPGPTP